MNTRISARTAVLSVAGALIVGAVGCDQPVPKCNVFTDFDHGGKFGARYTLVEGSKTGEGDCDQLHGEVLHFGSYFARGKGDAPNYDKVSVAIEPDQHADSNMNLTYAQWNGAATDIAFPEDIPWTMGAFDSAEPNSNDICTVSEFGDPARWRMPEVPEWQQPDPSDPTGETLITMPARAPIDTTYEFSNLKVYMTPDSPGRQASVDLTYTSGSCTAKYKVTAIFPYTYCNVDSTDEDGNPIVVASDEVCQTAEVFKNDDVECDPNTFLCVPKGDIPSLR